MKKILIFLSIILTIATLLTLVSCKNGKTPDGATESVLPSDTDDATGATESTGGDNTSDSVDVSGFPKLEGKLSVEFSFAVGDIYEHYSDDEGKLMFTNVRTLGNIGNLKNKYVYEYGSDGNLLRVLCYEFLDDGVEYYKHLTIKRDTVEFTASGDTLVGAVTTVHENGHTVPKTHEKIKIRYSNGKLSEAEWYGILIKYDESGRKISEKKGDSDFLFSYGTDGKISEANSADKTSKFVAQYDKSGYLSKLTHTENGDETVYSFNIEPTSGALISSSRKGPDSETSRACKYMSNGDILETSFVSKINDYGTVSETVTAEYDTEGRVSKLLEKEINHEGAESTAEKTYSYDKDGNVAEFSASYGKSIKYTYNSDGKQTNMELVEKKFDKTVKSTLVYTYDSEGRLASEVYTTEDFFSDDIKKYEYHANGHTKKLETVYLNDDGSEKSRSVEIYDENGYLLSETTYKGDKLDSLDEYLHEFELYDEGDLKKHIITHTYGDAEGPHGKTVTTVTFEPGSETFEQAYYTFSDGEWKKY